MHRDHPDPMSILQNGNQGGASAAMALVGIGAATLGVLVLAGIGAPVTLSSIAILLIGGAALLRGSALLARFGALWLMLLRDTNGVTGRVSRVTPFRLRCSP